MELFKFVNFQLSNLTVSQFLFCLGAQSVRDVEKIWEILKTKDQLQYLEVQANFSLYFILAGAAIWNFIQINEVLLYSYAQSCSYAWRKILNCRNLMKKKRIIIHFKSRFETCSFHFVYIFLLLFFKRL